MELSGVTDAPSDEIRDWVIDAAGGRLMGSETDGIARDGW